MNVEEFNGEYRFLSNFWPAPLEYEGLTYPSSEAAYQAAKTLDPALRLPFTTMTPGKAKRSGKNLLLREDWKEVNLQIMADILEIKFHTYPELMEQLCDTYPGILVEGNTWGDTFWGVCKGEGENHLGRILMALRDRTIKERITSGMFD
jgi:hypothetical protein